MMLLKSFPFLLAFAITARTAIVPQSHVLHEKRENSPSKWIKRERIRSAELLPMRIGLKQQNLERGHEFLMDVSHPESPKYGKHWTQEEIIDMFAPTPLTVNAIKQWLIGFGISESRITHTDNQAWIAFDATAETAEALLHTEYNFYEHTETGVMAAACDSYHVPKHVQEHVDYIIPGIRLLPNTKRGHSKRDVGVKPHRPRRPFVKNDATPSSEATGLGDCDTSITPDCIRALYGIPEIPEYPYGIPRSDNSLGIFEDGDLYSQDDLNKFFANFTSNIPAGTAPTPALIDGAQGPVDDFTEFIYDYGESDLDFQLAYPIVYPQTITLYQTDDAYYSEFFLGGLFNTFLDGIDGSYCTYSAFGETGNDPALDPVYPDPRVRFDGYDQPLQCGVYEPTNVISVSYGISEYDLPAYYQERQCNEYMKLGLQGVSIIIASGDEGVAGRPDPPFYEDNGCLGANYTIFSPSFPVNCPFVTSVGATQVFSKNVSDPESAASDPSFGYWSGGGFSNLYSTPDYQTDAVSSYFSDHDPEYPYYSGSDALGANGGIYNRSGRGIPDVSANGNNIAIFNGGFFGTSGGTSASTPIFASIINRINELRLNAGKSTLGFLNPALYANASIFNDITNGTNPGCGTEGFKSVSGWDPVTGLGTPNYGKMKDYFLSLP